MNAAGRSLRILVVDDHKDTFSALARLLSREGHEVATANSATEALAEAGKGRPLDLLVSDIGLPDFDGCELLRRLRETERRDLPAIALTGYGEENLAEACRRAGYGEFLLKPVAFGLLLAAVRAIAPVGELRPAGS